MSGGFDTGGRVSLTLKLAWRNIWRNYRRTLITLSAVCFGLASVILFNGFTEGFHEQWIANYVRVYTGHLEIHALGYNDDPELANNIAEPGPVVSAIRAMPEVDIVSTRVEIEGLASTADNSAGVLIRGIDTLVEPDIIMVDRKIIEGEYLRSDERGALIGHKLAKKLNAGVGNKLVLMTQAADGSMAADLFRVRGIFRMGAMDYDSSVVLVPEGPAREFAATGNGVTEITVLLKSPDDVMAMKERLTGRFGPEGLEVLTWEELMPALTEMIELDNVFLYIVLLIVLVIVAFGILNTTLMSIMERTREIGIMMALGTSPARVVTLVVTEAAIIGIIGTAAGVVLGVAGNYLIAIRGLDLGKWAGAMEFFAALDTVVYPETYISSVLEAGLLIFATAIITSIYPAWKASRLKPVEAIHHA